MPGRWPPARRQPMSSRFFISCPACPRREAAGLLAVGGCLRKRNSCGHDGFTRRVAPAARGLQARDFGLVAFAFRVTDAPTGLRTQRSGGRALVGSGRTLGVIEVLF